MTKNNGIKNLVIGIFLLVLTTVISTRLDGTNTDSWCATFTPLWIFSFALFIGIIIGTIYVVVDQNNDIEDRLRLCGVVVFLLFIIIPVTIGEAFLCQKLDLTVNTIYKIKPDFENAISWSQVLIPFLIAQFVAIIGLLYQHKLLA